MRIAIDYRVLSTEAANRGMGRYTQQQIREVLKKDNTNEFLILTYPNYQKRFIDPIVSSSPNVSFIPIQIEEIDNPQLLITKEKTYIFSAKFQEIFYKNKIDLYHATTPFIDPIITDFTVCPYVCTLYDLIPFIYPQHYFGNNIDSYQRYVRSLAFVRSSQRIISISESARHDVYTYLGYSKDRNQVAYPIIESCFTILNEQDQVKQLKNIGINIPPEFILSITGIHYSKNAQTLLNAFLLLPKVLQTKIPLILVFPSKTALQSFIEIYGTPDNVIYLNSVTDDELTGLYNAATMVVHPSRYEGFGYPVAEAMKCGTPVITTNVSSLPEIGDGISILVSPEDQNELKDAIVRLYSDPDLRNRMKMLGPSKVERFSEDQLGLVTIDSYKKAVFENRTSNTSTPRRRIAVWSSFPPLNCGVADYTSELVGALSEYCDIEVFIDHDYLPNDNSYALYAIHDYSSFEWRNNQKPFDLIIYQIGATYFQDFMYEMIEMHPGIIVIHDMIMGLGFYYIYLSRKELSIFQKKIIDKEGLNVSKAYKSIIKNSKEIPHAQLDSLFRKHYLLKWVMNNSLAQIVHLDHIKLLLEQKYINSNVHVVDMGVKDPWKGRSTDNPAKLKMKMGISPDTFVVGVFGSVVEVKRIESCIRALRKVVDSHDKVLLLIVGTHHDPAYIQKLQSVISELRLENYIRLTGRTEFTEFEDYFLLSEIVINLRYPTYKAMSAILIRALAAGKPVIISDVPEWADFCEEFCLRIQPDHTEIDNIAAYINDFISDTNLLVSASMKAREYFLKRGTTQHMAKQYFRVIEETLKNPRLSSKK